jgi:hypothetical protein
LPLGAAPRPGDQAPALGVELEPGRPAIVAFLRHTGCPFAEATMRSLRDAAAEAPDVQWVAISHAPDQATERWAASVGGPGEVRLMSDPSRASYAAWGLGRTSAGHFLGARSLGGVARLAREGIRNTHPHGTRWQSAGTFAIDGQAIVRWSHVPEHAGDLPALDVALAAVR